MRYVLTSTIPDPPLYLLWITADAVPHRYLVGLEEITVVCKLAAIVGGPEWPGAVAVVAQHVGWSVSFGAGAYRVRPPRLVAVGTVRGVLEVPVWFTVFESRHGQ